MSTPLKVAATNIKYDEEHGLWQLSKVLPLGASFPFDFGFIPSTRGEDGDPLDALIFLEERTFRTTEWKADSSSCWVVRDLRRRRI